MKRVDYGVADGLLSSEMGERQESQSSRELSKLINEGGVGKLSAETAIHRTQLWRYATGRRKPDADQIAKLHRASGGRVAADGWETLPPAGEGSEIDPDAVGAAE